MLVMEQVTKTYRPGDPPALLNASLTVERGELVALLGPSGAGKSTLIRCINGLVRPDSGRITVAGAEVTALTGAALQGVRRHVGIIFQEYNLVERLSTLTNALSGRFSRYPFWRNVLGLWSDADLTDARRLLDRVGLGAQADVPVRELSGGQRQRVAIARAMMQEPKLLVGDEPVSSLDPATARAIMQLLFDLTVEQGLTTILSLHDVALAREYCRRAVAVRDGRIIYDGPMWGVTDAVLRDIYEAPAPDAGQPSPSPAGSAVLARQKGCGKPNLARG